MHENTNTLLLLLSALFLIYSCSFIFNSFLSKIKLPSIVGELFCGILFAYMLMLFPKASFIYESIDFIKSSEVINSLGEIGIIILLLEVGMETEIKKILSSGKEASLVALGGVIAPFLLAYLFSLFFKGQEAFSVNQILFIGLVFAATSIGVTARVFKDLNILHNFNAQIILGAAVLDDVLGLILLATIIGIAKTGTFSILTALLILFKALAFLGLALWLNPKLTSKGFAFFTKLEKKNPLDILILVLILCFAFAAFAEFLGLAAIIGAFTLGITLDSVKIKSALGQNKKIEDYIAPIRAFLLPIFFVKIGLSIDPNHFLSLTAIIMLVLAIVSKLSSGWLLVPFKTDMNRLLVGIGMMPRGEVGLVVLAQAQTIKMFSSEMYSGLLFAIIATTVIAPIWLQYLLKKN